MSKRQYVPLHTHTGLGSPYDGLGYPDEFVKFVSEKGMNTMAITEHGNMNSLGEFVSALKSHSKDDGGMKGIYGVEAYYIPSIDEWQKNYDLFEQLKKDKKIKRGTKKINMDTDDITEGSYVDIACWVSKDDSVDIDDIVMKIKERYHILLLAMDEEGLKNLYTLVSKSHMVEDKRYFYKFPRIDKDLLMRHNKGIIGSSACMGGVLGGVYWNYKDVVPDIQNKIDDTNREFQSIFGDRWYNEIQFNKIKGQKEINDHVIKSAHKLNIPIIATVDSHFTDKNLWQARWLYNKMRFMRGSSVQEIEIPQDIDELTCQLYMKDGDEVFESYKEYSSEIPEELVERAIQETVKLSDRIDTFYPDNSVRLPNFILPEGVDPDDELRRLGLEGLRQKGFINDPDYNERLEHELDVIIYRGFSRYFLAMKVIVGKAKETMLNGVSRGSAGGSLLSYCLGITDIDPIPMNLDFSRFMTKGSGGYPDIDFDVSAPADFKELLKSEWGETSLAYVSNWNKLSFKSLIKDIAKFHGIPFQEVNNATTQMIEQIVDTVRTMDEYKNEIISASSFKVELKHLNYSKAYREFVTRYPEIKEPLETLLGQVRDVATHAGGVIIGDNLESDMPLIRKNDKLQTPWPESGKHRVLEEMGFVKFDILGISTLKMIENTIELILKKRGNSSPSFEDVRNYYEQIMLPSVLNMEDPDVWKNIFHDGNMIGVFQFTSPGMQSFCMQVKPSSIVELAAVTAIYRPGPMGANVHNDYAQTASGKRKSVYLGDEHRNVTEKTFGYLVFQEQLAELVHKLGDGITIDEGHKIRKLLTSKGEKQKLQAEEYKDKFIVGCKAHGITKTKALKLWADIVKFSGYGFNKIHAVGYSVVSYQCAWLCHYFPVEWASAYLNKESTSKLEKSIATVQKSGFKIMEVDINSSGSEWIPIGQNEVVQPLTSIKGLGIKTVEAVERNRPIASLEELMFGGKFKKSELNKKAMNLLIRSGAMDDLLRVVPEVKNKKQIVTVLEEEKKGFKTYEDFTQALTKCDVPNYTFEEKIENIFNLTGVFPSHLIFDDQLRDDMNKRGILSLTQFEDLYNEIKNDESINDYSWDNLSVWFILRGYEVKSTRRNRKYVRTCMVDDEGLVRYMNMWNSNDETESKLQRYGLYLAKVKYSEQWGFSISSNKNFMKVK